MTRELKEMLMDRQPYLSPLLFSDRSCFSDQLAKFSKHIGHGSNNALKNLLLLCIDVEVTRLHVSEA